MPEPPGVGLPFPVVDAYSHSVPELSDGVTTLFQDAGCVIPVVCVTLPLPLADTVRQADDAIRPLR